jgi:ABC-type branched-subunit amino acid transport system substrate-binding protein
MTAMQRLIGGLLPHRTPRRRHSRRSPAAACAAYFALVLAGCGEDTPSQGGRVIGDTLTITSLLPLSGPEAPAAREIVRGEKLALAQAGGRAGSFAINYNSIDEGGGEPEEARRVAAAATRRVLSDSQTIAVIGSLDYDAASASVPLLNAAGLLHVSPTVGYPGFTTELLPAEPERWYPSGRRTFVPRGGSDFEQAEVLLEAAALATGRSRPRVVIEREADPEDIALAEAVEERARDGAATVVEDATRADAVIYAGSDMVSAEGVAEAISREAPGARLVFGDDLARTQLSEHLSGAAAARAVFVSRAPRPGSTPALRRFEAEFREFYGRDPGPYAALGHAAMQSLLRDGIAPAGARANDRGQVIDTYLSAPRPSATWSAYRLQDGRRAYLPLDSGASD